MVNFGGGARKKRVKKGGGFHFKIVIIVFAYVIVSGWGVQGVHVAFQVPIVGPRTNGYI